MELQGKLIKVLSPQSGTGKNGAWKKQDIIVETTGQYPKKVCISIWGDKVDPSLLEEGNMLKIYFDIESREYNERWYTDVKAWKIELPDVGSSINPDPPLSGDEINPTEDPGILPF